MFLSRCSFWIHSRLITGTTPINRSAWRAMLAVAFDHLDAAAREDLLQPFLDDYRQNLVVKSRLFEGFPEVLETLGRAGMGLGIVTNKVESLTRPLLAQLGLEQRFAAVLCGDSLCQRKPDPAPVRLSARAA